MRIPWKKGIVNNNRCKLYAMQFEDQVDLPGEPPETKKPGRNFLPGVKTYQQGLLWLRVHIYFSYPGPRAFTAGSINGTHAPEIHAIGKGYCLGAWISF